MTTDRSRTSPPLLGLSFMRPVLLLLVAISSASAQDPQPLSNPSAARKSHSVAVENAASPNHAAPPGTVEIEPAGLAQTAPASEDGEATNDTAGERPDIQVNPEGRVEMHVRNSDLASVLQMLSIESRRNIVATKNVSGTVTANLYRVTFEEALTAILDSNHCTWTEKGNFIYVYTKEELSNIEAASRQRISRLFRLHYARAADIKPIIEPLLSETGKIAASEDTETGIATDSEEAGGDSSSVQDYVVVIDYPEHLEAISRIIAEIDVRPQQVLIEATILRALLTEENALGIDFNFVGGIDFRTLDGQSQAMTDLTLGQLPQPELEYTNTNLSTDFASVVPNGGLTFGIIENNVAMFIRALEQITDTNVMANPKVLALNKQRGEVIVGRRDGYLTTTVTETAAVQDVEFLETGTQLIFRPYIGQDGYIRMEIHPEDSTGGITAANLPFEQTTEVTTNIIIRDGNTILIGGLFREVTTSARSQLPIVGNLPIAGALFRNSDDNTQREEIVILLTVHLIKDDTQLADAGREMLEDVERFRVGVRQGVQWFGRERLAQAHYKWAIEHMNHGHPSKALWDLNLAINNNPNLLAAIQLKEDLLGERAWEASGSAIRGFLLKQIMKDEGVQLPLFGRPGPPFEFPALQGPNGFDENKATTPEPQPLSGGSIDTHSDEGDS